MRHKTPQYVLDYAQHREQGYTLEQIAKVYKCTKQAIFNALFRHGFIKKKERPSVKDLKEQVKSIEGRIRHGRRIKNSRKTGKNPVASDQN